MTRTLDRLGWAMVAAIVLIGLAGMAYIACDSPADQISLHETLDRRR